MRLTRPRTVDGVLTPLNRALTDLESIRADQSDRADAISDTIQDLEAERDEATNEATRASLLAGRIRGLIGESA